MRALRCTYADPRGRKARKGESGPGHSVLATNDVSFSVAHGEVFGILGPNGAGKSTLVRQMVGLKRPDSGSILLLGHDVIAAPKTTSRLVAYLAQEEHALAELPVSVALETTGRLRGLSAREAHQQSSQIIEELGLGALAQRALSKMSGGERRLAGVGCALIAHRPVLVLDEPTTGMDPHARRAVWDAINRRRAELGTSVVLVTHNVLEAEQVLDRVAVLEAGAIVGCDTPGRLKASVADDVRLIIVWKDEPPLGDATVTALAKVADCNGRRWTARMPQDKARTLLGKLMAGPAFAAVDDFSLATPTLEDAYMALGGRANDLEHA